MSTVSPAPAGAARFVLMTGTYLPAAVIGQPPATAFRTPQTSDYQSSY